jgi:hypothetical protein
MLFGFDDYKMLTTYVKDLFPDINMNLKGKIALGGRSGKEIIVVPDGLTKFECCMACKRFMYSMPHRGKVAFVFGVSDDIIGQAIDEWCPQWGKQESNFLYCT